MKIFSRNFWYVLFAIIVFASLMAFFTAHPLYIYDTDDWYYISFSRHAVPSMNQWNPTKILPETLMPLCVEIAVRFIMPCMGDYMGAMGMVFGIVVSISIIGYMISFGRYLSSQYRLCEVNIVWLITLLLLFHLI